MAATAPVSPPSAPIARPSRLLALTELPRALAECGALPWSAPLLASAPRGDGHAVLVLPGFLTTDASTVILRRYLARLGHDVHAWQLGRNLGPRAIGREGERLVDRLHAVHTQTGRAVSLVGWSLGGVMARLVAAKAPDAVRQIVTLGSPFSGNPRATHLRHAYEILTGQRIDDPHTLGQVAAAAARCAVPATAIFTKSDGIVAWQNCREPAGGCTESVEVRGSHCGLGVNAAALYAVADRLAQPEGGWRPFRPQGWKQWFYPG